MPHLLAELAVLLRIDLFAAVTPLPELLELLTDGVHLLHALFGGRSILIAEGHQALAYLRLLFVAQFVVAAEPFHLPFDNAIVELLALLGAEGARAAWSTEATGATGASGSARSAEATGS
ncbi:MAG: hypothetical protein WBL15_13310, partial [Phycisphaerae bacterium]